MALTRTEDLVYPVIKRLVQNTEELLQQKLSDEQVSDLLDREAFSKEMVQYYRNRLQIEEIELMKKQIQIAKLKYEFRG